MKRPPAGGLAAYCLVASSPVFLADFFDFVFFFIVSLDMVSLEAGAAPDLSPALSCANAMPQPSRIQWDISVGIFIE